MRRTDRLLFLGGAALVAAYFLALVHPTLDSFFTPDDMLGLHRAWISPLDQLIRANILFFKSSPFIRPMACALLRSIFYFAGYDAKPFHVALMIILGANLGLTYFVSRRLSGSREAAGVTVLLFSYHNRFKIIYFDTGFIYDPLCYCFYFAALLVYIRARQLNRALRIWEMAACCVLYICALNSKEMAVTLPVTLLAYELIYHPLESWRPAGILRWPIGDGRGVLVIGIATLAYVLGRTTGPDSLVGNPMYQPVLTWTQFMLTSRHFLGDVFSPNHDWSMAAVILLWSVLLAAAWISRQKALLFAWFFLMLSVLPIAFVAARGAPQYYIPWFGWVLYAAVAVVQSLAWVTRRLAGERPVVARVRSAAVLLSLVLALYPYYQRKGFADVSSVMQEAPVNREVAAQLHALHPRLRPLSRLLFLNDPIRADWPNMTFIVQLSYNDRTLEIARAKEMPRPPDERQRSGYEYVFDYRDGHFLDVTPPPPWRPAGPPAIAVTDSAAPEIYHSDFSPVSAYSPARPGERLIAGATDLGPTRPALPPDQAFPDDPFLAVASEIVVRVNGRPADVSLKIGWPSMVNHYRVDFTVPKQTGSGTAVVFLMADGRAGPAAEIPVR